jgi:hypothetical protein
MALIPSFFDLDPWSTGTGGWYPTRRHRRRQTSPWGTLARFEDVMTDMDRQLSQMERDLSRAFSSLGVSRPGELGFFSPQTESESGGVEGKEPGKYAMNIFLGNNIGPEDVKVSCKDNIMTIDAKKEYKSEDGNSRVYQEYMRKFTLPQGVDMKEIKSELTPEGYLRIEAPVHRQAIEEQKKQPQAIPIKKE